MGVIDPVMPQGVAVGAGVGVGLGVGLGVGFRVGRAVGRAVRAGVGANVGSEVTDGVGNALISCDDGSRAIEGEAAGAGDSLLDPDAEVTGPVATGRVANERSSRMPTTRPISITPIARSRHLDTD
jgi:hypothetical protein